MQRRVIRRGWCAALAAAFVACTCSGCGSSDRAHVTGTLLRHDGTPLVGASIVATSSETGKSASASTDQQGNFEFGSVQQGDGIPPGNYDVIIVEDRGDPDHRRPPSIADKYRDPAKSELKVIVKAGDTAELNLKLDPP